MNRIDSPTATVDNKFTEGNPALSVPATVVSADWLNAIQEEICAVIESEIELDPEDNAQLAAVLAMKFAIVGSVIPRVYEESTTWTKPAGLKAVRVRGVGGGGGSGAVSTTNSAASTGGSAAGYFEKIISADQLGDTEDITIGDGGPGGVNGGNGQDGGTTSFGAHCSAGGGKGGQGATTAGQQSGVIGGVATGGDINIPGSESSGVDSAIYLTSSGGQSILGARTRSPRPGPTPGLNYGSGASGSYRASGINHDGEQGSPGILFLEEIY